MSPLCLGLDRHVDPGTLKLPKGMGPASSPVRGSHGNHGLDKRIPCALWLLSALFCLQPHLFLLTSHLLVLAIPIAATFCQPQKETSLILSSGRRKQVSLSPRIISIGSMGTLLVLGRGIPSLTSLGILFPSNPPQPFLNRSKLPKSQGFPGGSVVEKLPANAGDARDSDSIPGLGRAPREGNRNPLQHSCLGNPNERSLEGYSPHSCRVRHDRARMCAGNHSLSRKLFDGIFNFYFHHSDKKLFTTSWVQRGQTLEYTQILGMGVGETPLTYFCTVYIYTYIYTHTYIYIHLLYWHQCFSIAWSETPSTFSSSSLPIPEKQLHSFFCFSMTPTWLLKNGKTFLSPRVLLALQGFCLRQLPRYLQRLKDCLTHGRWSRNNDEMNHWKKGRRQKRKVTDLRQELAILTELLKSKRRTDLGAAIPLRMSSQE